ncbi:hypothetical protein D3C73_1081680 [compost metagenome]
MRCLPDPVQRILHIFDQRSRLYILRPVLQHPGMNAKAVQPEGDRFTFMLSQMMIASAGQNQNKRPLLLDRKRIKGKDGGAGLIRCSSIPVKTYLQHACSPFAYSAAWKPK